MDIYGNIIDAIGNTPMLELGGYARHIGAKARLLVKLENRNPGGSIKDRVAARMLLDAEDDGRLTPDTVIIEPTSGNTGIGLAALCGTARTAPAACAAPPAGKKRGLSAAFPGNVNLSACFGISCQR